MCNHTKLRHAVVVVVTDTVRCEREYGIQGQLVNSTAPTGKSMSEFSVAPTLQRHLYDTWSNHSIAGENKVQVIDADAGKWNRQRCRSPDLFFFLCGHARTIAWTTPFIAQVARASSQCSWVMVMTPDELDAPPDMTTPGARGRVNTRGLERAYGTAMGNVNVQMVHHDCPLPLRVPAPGLIHEKIGSWSYPATIRA